MHFDILDRFIKGEADVLIGTQMIAKGLDLPLVTLVGVVSADMGLALPDYRAGERVFQLLTQVAGRAGRGVLGGSVILQTYQPEHYVIQAASQHDYAGFAERESRYRQELGYPPYRRLARIVFSYSKAETARQQAELRGGAPASDPARARSHWHPHHRSGALLLRARRSPLSLAPAAAGTGSAGGAARSIAAARLAHRYRSGLRPLVIMPARALLANNCRGDRSRRPPEQANVDKRQQIAKMLSTRQSMVTGYVDHSDLCRILLVVCRRSLDVSRRPRLE